MHIKESPYTVREARIHVRHVRDLLKSLESLDAYNGAECSSLSFLNTVTQGDIVGELGTNLFACASSFGVFRNFDIWLVPQ